MKQGVKKENQLSVLLEIFSQLLGLQLATRIATFIFNIFTIRFLSPEIYGLAALQFPLLTSSVLFLSREGFRRGCLRLEQHTDSPLDKVLTTSLLPIPIGITMTVIVCKFLSHGTTDRSDMYLRALFQNDSLKDTILNKGVATVVELLSEPFYIASSILLKFKLRTRIEGVAIFFKGAYVLTALKFTSRHPVLVFADSQLAYATILLIGYSTLIPEIASVIGRWRVKKKYKFKLNLRVLQLSMVFSLQAVLKLALAEGSKFTLILVENLYNQGVYGLVNNLGSIIVRILFQPFEEAAFTAFGRSKVINGENGETVELLRCLIRCSILVGLLLVTFGPSSSALLLEILFSQRWSNTEAPRVLASYCFYLALLALNGITEAFVHAVLDIKGLTSSNLWMLLFASTHMILSYVLVRAQGSMGLVIADAINMITRISFSAFCIKKVFRDFDIASVIPSNTTLTTAASIFFILSFLKYTLPLALIEYSFIYHVIIYIVLASLCLANFVRVVYIWEGEILQKLKNLKSSQKIE